MDVVKRSKGESHTSCIICVSVIRRKEGRAAGRQTMWLEDDKGTTAGRLMTEEEKVKWKVTIGEDRDKDGVRDVGEKTGKQEDRKYWVAKQTWRGQVTGNAQGEEKKRRWGSTPHLICFPSVPTCCCPSFYHQTQKGFRKQTQKGNVTNMWGDTDFHLELRQRAQSNWRTQLLLVWDRVA